MRQPSQRQIAALQANILSWFATNGRRFPWRRKSATHYQRIVSEILLQRTRAEVAARFLPRFTDRYSSWSQLASASESDLGEFLRPIGLWRRRAESLIKLAGVMAARGGRFPRTRTEVEALPAVGQYVCNAIMLFTGRLDEPLLDVNMARVLERCFGPRKLVDIRYDPDLQGVSRLVVAGPHATELNWAILDLAAVLCTQRAPRCSECPLRRSCDLAKAARSIARGQ